MAELLPAEPTTGTAHSRNQCARLVVHDLRDMFFLASEIPLRGPGRRWRLCAGGVRGTEAGPCAWPKHGRHDQEPGKPGQSHAQPDHRSRDASYPDVAQQAHGSPDRTLSQRAITVILAGEFHYLVEETRRSDSVPCSRIDRKGRADWHRPGATKKLAMTVRPAARPRVPRRRAAALHRAKHRGRDLHVRLERCSPSDVEMTTSPTPDFRSFRGQATYLQWG